MIRLPRAIDDLRGLRAARWIRESTAGQVDNFGPDAQREQQDRAIERYGLVDSGLAWQVAHSGKTIATTSGWAEMVGAAGRDYDVLVVGYVSRFARDLETAVNARRDLHRAGAVVLFADERILTSDEDAWEHWARESVEAEAYSRRLGKRIREGYAAKRRRHADQAGRAPFGFLREAEKPHRLAADPDRLPVLERLFRMAAEGATDQLIATTLGLPLFTVRGILTSPLYVGRLRTGERAGWPPLVPAELWEQAQAVRARRATNTGRPATPARAYALPMLRCASCGRRLHGDTGYYRHREPCEAFLAAQPPRPKHRGRVAGKGYRREWYEAVIGELLAMVSLRADTLTAVVGQVSEVAETEPDRLALARIERERESALARYRRDRDARALEATMARLDADEAEAAKPRESSGMPAGRAVAWLGALGDAWEELKDRGDERRRLASALFDSLDVEGFRTLRPILTSAAVAHGFADVLPEHFTIPARGIVGNGRGERGSPSLTQLSPPFKIINVTPRDLLIQDGARIA